MDLTLLRQFAWVFLFGGVGACSRVAAAEVLERRLGEQIPFVGVLSVNVLGCLLIGIAAESIRDPTVRMAVLGGFLGGFTTYSAFGLLVVELGEAGRWGPAVAQVATHIVLGIVAAVAGGALARAAGWTALW